MGFYSAATLVEDAKRHKVEVRAVDVQQSEWDCTMEPCPGSGEGFAVRMGLRYVKGLSKKEGERIVEARQRGGAFGSIPDFSERTGLEPHVAARLAEAGAFEVMQPRRREALWESLGQFTAREEHLTLQSHEREVAFNPLDDMESVNWDYMFTEHSTRGHPLAGLREVLAAQRLPDAATVKNLPHGRRIRYAGLVICRQRPGTAQGVVFMTLEDETGLVNVVLWKKVFDKFELLAKTQHFLGVTGKLQIESGVVHLVAEELWEPTLEREPREVKSRNFH